MQNFRRAPQSRTASVPNVVHRPSTFPATVQAWLEVVNTTLWMLILMTVVYALLSTRVAENDLRIIDGGVNLPVASVNLLADCLLGLLILPAAKQVWGIFLAMRPLALFSALTIASTIWSINPGMTIRRGGYLLIDIAAAAYFGMRYTPKQLARITCAAAFGLVVMSVVAYGMHPDSVLDPSHPGQWRGLTGHKNVFGQYVGLALVFALLVDLGKFALLRPLLVATMAVMLYLSHSSTCWLLAVICLLAIPLFTLIARVRTLAVPLLMLSATILLVIGTLTLPVTGQLMQAMGKDPTLTGRTELWEGLLHSAAKRPLLGYGYEAFFSKPDELVGLQSHAGWLPPHAHNGYLQVLISTGLVGGALTIWFIIEYLVTSIRFAQRNRTRSSLIPLVAILFWLIHNAVEVTLMQGQSFLPVINFALLAAMKAHPYEDTVVRLGSAIAPGLRSVQRPVVSASAAGGRA